MKHFKSQVASTVPFDPTAQPSYGFISTDVESAIYEAANLGADASRGGAIASFDGTGSTGRWLEFSANNPSNNSPFVVAEVGQIRSISIVTSATKATGTVTIFKNGSSIETISLAAEKKSSKTGLFLGLISLDGLSIQVTSGSIARPQVTLFIQTY
jgi:hypothetical protein